MIVNISTYLRAVPTVEKRGGITVIEERFESKEAMILEVLRRLEAKTAIQADLTRKLRSKNCRACKGR